MSLWNSLYTGVSGMNAHGLSMGVIGDNIANVSTVGFKGARANFGDLLATFLPSSGGPAQLGRGVQLLGIEQNFTQGAALQTENPLDLSLQGEGMFVVRGQHNGVSNNFFTRAGQFRLDRDGFLVNTQGLRVQGFDASTGSNGVGDLRLGNVTTPPQATSSVEVTASLNPGAALVDSDGDGIPDGSFLATDPVGTSNFSTTITTYDSLGQPHQLEVYLTRTGAGTWDWNAMVPSGELPLVDRDPGGASMTVVGQGNLQFDVNGALDVENVTQALAVNFLDAAPGQAIALDFGDSITTDAGTGLSGTTQYSGQASAIVTQFQDGLPTGSLQSVSVSAEGNIVGGFSNGTTRELGQVAVASFTNYRGLNRLGSNLWSATPDSGQAAVGTANTGGRGGVVSHSLEQSNVEIADEFVTMITTQRGFQANSRTITTADTLLGEVIQLRR